MVENITLSILPTLLTPDKNAIKVVIRNNAPAGINIVDAGFILTIGAAGHCDRRHLRKKFLAKDEETDVMFQLGHAAETPVRLEYQIRFQIENGPLREDEGEFRYNPDTRTFSLVTGNGPIPDLTLS